MYIDTVPNRNSRPAVLLREGWREGRRTRKRTLANLTDWPLEKIQALQTVLKGNYRPLTAADGFSIERTRPHGHVAAVLGTLRRLKLEQLIGATRGPERNAVVAMIVARVLEPRSKLALARRHLSEATLALYDVSSTYFEGRCCPLARYGYSRDGKRDKLQITFGLLTNAEGCPLAVEVFEGNTADPKTLGAVIAKCVNSSRLSGWCWSATV